MNKELNQEIMVRSKLRNKFLKPKTEENSLRMLSSATIVKSSYNKNSDSTLKS